MGAFGSKKSKSRNTTTAAKTIAPKSTIGVVRNQSLLIDIRLNTVTYDLMIKFNPDRIYLMLNHSISNKYEYMIYLK